MGRIRIYPYVGGSRSAKLLATTLDALCLRTNGRSRFVPREDDVVINWGSTQCPSFAPATLLNRRTSIINAANKLTTFLLLQEAGVRIPEFWWRHADCPAEGTKLVARRTTTGHSGLGIEIGEKHNIPRDNPLYTRYIPKEQEYRVHCVGGHCIFIQRKARKLDVEEPNWEVRNLAGGFVFIIAESTPRGIEELAIQSVNALGLDFGAVDVVQGVDGQLYVLEVNTACGLEERTANKYTEALSELIEERSTS